jgi:methionyl aminopeptidase
MVYIKSEKEINAIEVCNKIVAETLKLIEKIIEPGIDTETIDREAENFILSKKAKPAFKGLYGFPKTTCISINEEVVHGIPGKRRLKSGDIVGVDIGVELNSYYGDAAYTYPVGSISPDVARLCKITEESLYLGIKQCRPGNKVGDISSAIQTHVEKFGFSVVRDLVGHGVGIKPHEDPQIPNFGEKNKGPRLKTGMVIAIEPMINLGGFQVYVDNDEWTVRTVDGKPSAHYEHSVAILKDGPKILSTLNEVN